MSQASAEFIPVRIVILTVTGHRTSDNDTSGHYLRDAAIAAGHQVLGNVIIPEDIYQIRAQVSKWIADEGVQVILMNGGTGFTSRDRVPEAIGPLFDREIAGFGELFRMLSYESIGTASLQSRAVAGMANRTLIFAVPGSTNACRTAWEKIIIQQLDARQRPCNFYPHLKS